MRYVGRPLYIGSFLAAGLSFVACRLGRTVGVEGLDVGWFMLEGRFVLKLWHLICQRLERVPSERCF